MRSNRFALAVAAVGLWAAPASGQTTFAWPDTAVDIASYTRLVECEAAIARSRHITKATELIETGVWTDTLPLDRDEVGVREPLPEPVVETVRRCGARFANVDTVSLDDFAVLLPFYLEARWDDRAHRLIERRLAAVPETKEDELYAAADTAIRVLLARGYDIGQPRDELAEEVALSAIARIDDRVKRLRLYSALARNFASGSDPDSARAHALRFVERMAPILDSLTDKEFDELAGGFGAFGDGLEEGGDFVRRYYAILNMSLGKETFLDSLRESTAAYVRTQKDNWARATGMRPETYKLGNPLGEKAPPIGADVWLGHDPATGPRPTPGRVSLVVFLDAHECLGTATQPENVSDNCARSLYPLHRIERRFPELEVTVLAQSSGHFTYEKQGMTPEREARLAKLWLESYGVHAALAMTASSNVRLPDPDSRHFRRPGATQLAYTFGRSWGIVNGLAMLIDRDGTVVHVRNANRSAEAEDFNELIEILLGRQQEHREMSQ